jgi:biuret amidohydrolase
MKKALINLDFINEIIHEKGKLAGKGYPAFATKNNTLERVKEAVRVARNQAVPTIWVRLSFSSTYAELPLGSPLFGKAGEFQALKSGSWGTRFHSDLEVRDDDLIIEKHRVSAFFGTDLEMQLRSRGITEVLLAGCSTDLAVEAAARDAHDRDFKVTVLSDCCAAASEEDHQGSLITLAKIGKVKSLKEVFHEQ